MNLQVKIDRIKNSLASGAYTLAASESVKIIEISLRYLLSEGVSKFKSKNRLTVMSSILKVGKGERDIEDIGLGSMLAIVKSSNFFNLWEESTGNSLTAIRMINFDAINEVRNKLEHKGYEASKYEAEFLAHAVENVIHEFGLLKLHETDRADRKLADKPDGQSTCQENKNKDKSSYSPTEFTESHRLAVQSRFCKEIDEETFRYALSKFDKKENLVALDVGCANGYLTYDRFEPFAAFSKIIGIDRDPEAIKEAESKRYGDRYSFYRVDVEEEGFIERIQAITNDEDVETIDFIFSGLTIHHLSSPVKALRNLRRVHVKGGPIIVRGSDDGSKLAYPDEDHLVSTILQLSQSVSGYSDRRNGRKIYNQLWRAGYRQIEMFFDTKSTASMTLDERKDFFDMCMSWRVNPLLKALEYDPLNTQIQDDIEKAKEILTKLELMFEQEDFFFSQQRISGVGFKP